MPTKMNVVLLAQLRPLQAYLQQKDLVELTAVQSGQVGLELAGSGYQWHDVPNLSFNYWRGLCQVLANLNGITFDLVQQPRVSTALPGGHRFEAMLGKNVQGDELSVSIRMRRSIQLTLEDFGLKGSIKDRIIKDIQTGKTVLVSGGTSSGKTTFLNVLIPYIPEDKRVLSVEDTRELMIPHLNQVNYIVSRNEATPYVGYSHVIDHLMRSRPDIILAGELSIANTFPILRLLNSGHKGFMCTLHANSPDLALDEAIPANVMLSGNPAQGVSEYLRKTVDVVIQLHRLPSGRREVTEVLFPIENEQTLVNNSKGDIYV